MTERGLLLWAGIVASALVCSTWSMAQAGFITGATGDDIGAVSASFVTHNAAEQSAPSIVGEPSAVELVRGHRSDRSDRSMGGPRKGKKRIWTPPNPYAISGSLITVFFDDPGDQLALAGCPRATPPDLGVLTPPPRS